MLDVHADAALVDASLQTQALLVMIVSAFEQLAAASLMPLYLTGLTGSLGDVYQHCGSKHAPTDKFCKHVMVLQGGTSST